MEALLRQNWRSFIEDLEDDREAEQLEEAVSTVTLNVQQDLTTFSIEQLYNTPELENLRAKSNEYNESATKMGKYWLSYIAMVGLLLRFVRSTREGNWSLHLACIRDMIPWMFAYDRTNYSRYLPVYWCDMMTLEEKHPASHEAFQAGEFVVQRSSHGSFSQVAVDQTIEQTINRDTKSKGGIVGFSLNKGAVQRWLLTSHERAAITQACREMAGLHANDANEVVKEMGKARMATDERDVKKVETTLSNWVNPFNQSADEEIYHLASGLTASEKLEHDLLTAHNQGKQAMMEFFRRRLLSPDVSFYDPIKKLKLTNFTSSPHSKIKISGRDIMIKADRNLFARLLLAAQKRSMDLREVFQYPLGPLPWSLVSADGSLGKTDKSKLLESLTTDIDFVEDVPPTAAIIVDGMAVLQSLKQVPETFEELALAIFHHTISRASLARRVDFVTDRYPEISIKHLERTKRANEGIVKVKITGSGQKCPKQWKKYLNSGDNKSELSRFLLQEWSRDRYRHLIGNRKVFFTLEMKCFRLSVVEDKVSCDEILELNSNHEEADTKLLLHAKHAAENGERTIVIKSPDTDVAVLACHFSNQIPARLLIMKKAKTRVVYLDVKAISDAAGPQLCDALPGLHAFPGCDSVSSFSGKGKKAPLKLCRKNEEASRTMKMLGRTFNADEALLGQCEKVVCCLYGYPGMAKVNKCRYQMFASKQKQSHCLPPCEDALKQHTMRANYQSAVWRRALVANPYVPSPEGHGWIVEDGNTKVNWMSLPPAPVALLELVMCACNGNCSTGHCSCNRNLLSCTDACQCSDECQNPHNVSEHSSEDDDYEEELGLDVDDEDDEDVLNADIGNE